jgi:hypothetical protein
MGAALLVLLGLGFFVAGILTGVTWLYWSCVAACVMAAVLLFATHRRMATSAPSSAPTTPIPPSASASGTAPVAGHGSRDAPADLGEPPVEEVEVTDLLLVVDLEVEVLVVDEHPRYHLAGCAHLAGRTTIPLPLDEARTDGFTPCGVCRPDATLADRVRAEKGNASS